jgi:hypothetical protein
MRWWADNSELNGIKEAEIPDILMFGGIAVSDNAERELCIAVEAIKERYADFARAPIKWNLKDLKEIYKKKEMNDTYNKLLGSAREWRMDVFQAIASVESTLIVACIECFSTKRDVLKQRKDDLARYVFTNGLMRFGLHVMKTKPPYAQVVLDWPDKGISKPFDTEYAYAYSSGKTADKQVTYKCGELCKLGFADSVYFTNMLHSTMLQIADLVVGASREFIECCIGKKDAGQGLGCLRIVKDRFRGAPNNIFGRGLILPSGNQEFLSCVRAGIESKLNSA